MHAHAGRQADTHARTHARTHTRTHTHEERKESEDSWNQKKINGRERRGPRLKKPGLSCGGHVHKNL